MNVPTQAVRPWPDCPLVVAYGLGVNSTAMLGEFANRGVRPDLILFADTGGEKPETRKVLTSRSITYLQKQNSLVEATPLTIGYVARLVRAGPSTATASRGPCSMHRHSR